MFNNVWFYIGLYGIIGAMVVLADMKVYMIMRKKLLDINWGAACRFEDKALIQFKNKVSAWTYVTVVTALWPIGAIFAMAKKLIAYKKVMKEELEAKEWEKRFEEITEKWLAQ